MTLITKDLGLIKALHAGPVAPANRYMLWNDTNITSGSPFKYWDQVSETWELIAGVNANDHIWTVELRYGKVIEIFAPFQMRILSKQTIVGNPTVTITINGFPYVLGDLISEGTQIRMSVVDFSTTNYTIEAPMPGYTYFKADPLTQLQYTLNFASLPLSALNNWTISLITNIPQGKVIHKIVAVGTGINDPVGDNIAIGMVSDDEYFTVSPATLNSDPGGVSVGNSKRTLAANENIKVQYLGGSGTVNTGTLRFTLYVD
jgi:hypothetical protein